MSVSDYEKFSALFEYNPKTGDITRKSATARLPAGSLATYRGANDWMVKVDGKPYYARRVAWLLAYGEWPEHVVPINGDKTDIRLSNLRLQTRSETQESSKLRSTNTSGVRGARFNPQIGKWVASFTKEYKRYHLGIFDTKEEAIEALEQARNAPIEELGPGTDLTRDPRNVRRKRFVTQKIAKENPVVAGWSSYEEIVAELGLPESDRHILTRVNPGAPIGPGNARWQLPWKEITPEGERRRYHVIRSGYSPEEYDRMVADQKNLCSICGRPETVRGRNGKVRSLAADHDHVTGKPRSPTCFGCNTTVGRIEKTPGGIAAYAAFFARHARKDE